MTNQRDTVRVYPPWPQTVDLELYSDWPRDVRMAFNQYLAAETNGECDVSSVYPPGVIEVRFEKEHVLTVQYVKTRNGFEHIGGTLTERLVQYDRRKDV